MSFLSRTDGDDDRSSRSGHIASRSTLRVRDAECPFPLAESAARIQRDTRITMNETLERHATITSPYTLRNVDAAIGHLERVLSAEGANSLFGQTYWRTRVQQVRATRGLQREQRARLERLMKLLTDGGCV